MANKNDNVKCEDACECAEELGQKVRAFMDGTAGQARDVMAGASKQVRSNPLQAAAIAAGVGFILGALLRRKG